MLKDIHKKSIYNAKEIKDSEQCGCFYCVSVQDSKDVTYFVDDETTGMCPNCHIDSLLPNITDLSLLSKMHDYAFSIQKD